MADKPHVPIPTDTHESLRGKAVALGCFDVQTPQGPVHFHDAPGFITTLIERVGVPTSIGLFVYQPGEVGRVVQFDADGARSAAASLLRLADKVEPRKPS